MIVLIPMAGKGLRLQDNGFQMPKPLIEIKGIPMVQRVIENTKLDAKFIYVVRKEHVDHYSIDIVLNKIKDGEVFQLKKDNQGQTQTCLLAESALDCDEELLIINCDNYFIWDQADFEQIRNRDDLDGAAFTFKDEQNRSHWCFAELNEDGNIKRLVEKEPISDVALAGAFYWKKSSDFVKFAKQSIEKGLKASNGEFYLGSVFQEAINCGKKIVPYKIPDMKCMGTPEELESFNKWLDLKDKTFNNSKGMNSDNITKNRKIQSALDDLREGKPVVLVDEYDRENEGDVVIAGEKANIENIVFTMNKAKGLMCIPCEGTILDRLNLPPMVEKNTDINETPFTVSVDAARGTTTGMSVHDRLATISVFLDENSKPEDLNRPGHLFPLRARDGLFKDRRGHTEGSIELMKLAGLKPVAIICEMMNDDGTMCKGGEITKFAVENGLTILSTEEVYEAAYHESL